MTNLASVAETTEKGNFFVAASAAQERLWFFDQLERGNPFYNVPQAIRVRGTLDVVALRRTLEEIVQRHESLRTTFLAVDGRPMQVISPAGSVRLEETELSGQMESTVSSLIQEEIRRPFDLSSGPLFRALLIRLNPEEHILVLTSHHIVSDGWSIGVLYRELAPLYEAFSAGRPSPLPPLPIQYADYAVWQREQRLGRERLEGQLAYWRTQLADLAPSLSLPTDRPRPASQTYVGARVPVSFTRELTESLKRIGQGESATLFMTLLAAFQALLYRYTGQQDVVVGSQTAGRTRVELEDLIGFFVNALVLRTDLSADPTFRELLRRVRTVALGAYAHQDLPFERLVEELQPERTLSGNPLFQVSFVLQNQHRTRLGLSGLELSPLEVHTGTTKFDLSLSLTESSEGLRGRFEYASDLFDRETIQRMVSHFERLLAAIAENPDEGIARLPLLAEAEREQMLVRWNQTRSEFPSDSCLHQIIEERARRSPEAAAGVFGDVRLSYGELDRRASQLARRLRSMGVGPEDRVAVCLDPTPDLLVALLGILKAGAAYVPLDPSSPPERHLGVIEDSSSKVLISAGNSAEGLSSSAASMLHLDREREALLREPVAGFASGASPESLAYLIYTSGSTGRPKGVMVSHCSVLNYLQWVNETLFGGASVRLPVVTPLGFDASLKQLWSPLLRGDAVWLLPREVATRPDALRDALEGAGAVALNCVPALWSALLEDLERASGARPLPHLTALYLGGERIPPELVERTLRLLPHLEIWNLYGPTETTANATAGRLLADQRVSIGRPIANARAYVLDALGQPVPVGVAGDLYIGGEGVARGYSGRPDLTAELFVPDPFAPRPGQRLYRTGDVARYRADGAIEFLGRRDGQVKVRGFRIELGEIEAVAAEYPGVGECVILAREEEGETQGLTAYVTTREDGDRSEPESAVNQWQMIHDEAHRQREAPEDPTFDVAGWNSSYTGLPIPAAEMHEWVDRTVERILSLNPRRVLEIGCGSGLLLYRIAPRCERYEGTDFSEMVIRKVARQLSLEPALWGHVSVSPRRADDFRGWEPGAFDVVILNSVVQYFPDAEYLVRVLEGALELLTPGGSVFIGDVRSLPLLEPFHASVQLNRAAASMTVAELQRRVRRNTRHEEELVLAPAFFQQFARRYPERICRVEARPKRGRASNEMTRFRYDVTLRVGKAGETATAVEWESWSDDGWTTERLSRLLAAEAPELAAFRGIPNARVIADIEATDRMKSGDHKTVGELREAVSRRERSGVDPEDLWAIASDLPYTVELSWSTGDPQGSYDALLRRRARPGESPRAGIIPFPGETARLPSSRHVANNPRRGQSARQLPSQLRGYLAEKLPPYMVPSAVVVLDELPLTRHGKVDLRALPEPDQRPELGEAYVAPRDEPEERIARIWSRLLGIERVGVHDDFFALGGHSLLATQVIARIRVELGADLPLRALFEAPTVAGLAERLATSRGGYPDGAPPALKPVSREGPLPLSFAQQRLWFLDQLTPGAAYNVPRSLRISGPLDTASLEKAIREVVRRHESLRTRFPAIEGHPAQVIDPPSGFSLETVDVGNIPRTARETVARKLAREESARPFDLAAGPLFRARLLRLAAEDHVLLLTSHHIVSDAWSAVILLREIGTIYAAYLGGESPALPDLPIQYADYAVWQRDWLDGPALRQQLEYWRKQLAGMPPFLDLPMTRSRPSESTDRGEHFPQPFSSELSEKLLRFSERNRVTPYMTALAAFQVLLSRRAGREDIVVGADVANRARVETEGLIGFFVNLLVLRTDLSGDPTFREALQRVREVALAAYAHQDVPFEKLVEELKPPRDIRRNPLVQVLLVQMTERAKLQLPGLEVRTFTRSERSRFDLVLFLYQEAQGISGEWLYKPDLFDGAAISRLSEEFRMLLEAAVDEPDRRLSALATGVEAKRRSLNMVSQPPPGERKLSPRRRRAVDVSSAAGVKTSALSSGAAIPLVFEPDHEEIDLVAWAGLSRSLLEEKLLRHGALLFRGFDVDSVERFEQFAQILCPELFGEYGDLPREGVAGKVYSSTPYPADEMILYHNESSHMHRWPMKIWFYCVQAAQTGGETPVVDCRRIYEALDPAIRARFAELGLLYVRNYTAGMDVSWQIFFGTSDGAEVEEQCRLAGVDSEWTAEGLRTRQRSPAVLRHPRTGETVFFNQLLLHHASCLAASVRESLVSLLGEENLPRNVFYGDGTVIPDEVVAEVRGVYDRLAARFPWRDGDILMVNNMLAAHARLPFSGPRKIVVAMGEMVNKSEVDDWRRKSEAGVRGG